MSKNGKKLTKAVIRQRLFDAGYDPEYEGTTKTWHVRHRPNTTTFDKGVLQSLRAQGQKIQYHNE